MHIRKSKKTVLSDEALLIALACGATVESASSKSGLSSRTIYRRLENPDFRKKLQDYRNDLVTRATSMLSATMMEAVKTLLQLMATTSSSAARLGAARCILEMGLKLRQATELEERMQFIEQRIHQQDQFKPMR